MKQKLGPILRPLTTPNKQMWRYIKQVRTQKRDTKRHKAFRKHKPIKLVYV